MLFWRRYYISMDTVHPFTAAELNFLSQSRTESGEPRNSMYYCSLTPTSLVWIVPVVVAFTKLGTLGHKVFCGLREGGLSWEYAKYTAPVHVVADFERKHLGKLYQTQYPPMGHIYLRGKMLYCHMCRG
jgi:hypothetical protein